MKDISELKAEAESKEDWFSWRAFTLGLALTLLLHLMAWPTFAYCFVAAVRLVLPDRIGSYSVSTGPLTLALVRIASVSAFLGVWRAIYVKIKG